MSIEIRQHLVTPHGEPEQNRDQIQTPCTAPTAEAALRTGSDTRTRTAELRCREQVSPGPVFQSGVCAALRADGAGGGSCSTGAAAPRSLSPSAPQPSRGS